MGRAEAGEQEVRKVSNPRGRGGKRTVTLMVVHAHPDDEGPTTGGVLARYSDEGVRTVLVTCTDGGLGVAADGTEPGRPGHDVPSVVEMRRHELEESCKILGVSHLERLEYPDSGMLGWPSNAAPGAFWNTPVEVAAARLAVLMEVYHPQVVVTYDEHGLYGHPDHIQAHRVTMAAVAACGIPERVYLTAVPRSLLAGFAGILADQGIALPDAIAGDGQFGTPDELITTTVDCTAVAHRKFDSVAAHGSQPDNQFFLSLGRELFTAALGREGFVLSFDRTGTPEPEDDLFAGIR